MCQPNVIAKLNLLRRHFRSQLASLLDKKWSGTFARIMMLEVKIVLYKWRNEINDKLQRIRKKTYACFIKDKRKTSFTHWKLEMISFPIKFIGGKFVIFLSVTSAFLFNARSWAFGWRCKSAHITQRIYACMRVCTIPLVGRNKRNAADLWIVSRAVSCKARTQIEIRDATEITWRT